MKACFFAVVDRSIDSGAMLHLLERRYSEQEILDLVYNAAQVIVDSALELSETQQEIEQGISYETCSCKKCETRKMGANANTKTFRIGVSRAAIEDMLRKPSPLIGLLQVIHLFIHEMLHGLQ